MDFFSHLELHLRQEHPPLAGRDHMAFRGSYYPVRDALTPLLRVPGVSCIHRLTDRSEGRLACALPNTLQVVLQDTLK